MHSLGLLADKLLLQRPFFHLLFLVFAILVVHACQRLVEHASQHIEAEEREAGVPRAAFCIGCLVWALDVMGFLMYPWANLGQAQLLPALLALTLMILLTRLLVPLFLSPMKRVHGWLGAAGMAAGTPVMHLLVASSFGRQPMTVNAVPVFLALATTLGIAGGLSVLHRNGTKKQSSSPTFVPLGWSVKFGAGLAVLALHRFLDAAIPLEQQGGSSIAGTLPMVLVLVLFGVIVGADQVFALGADLKRREVFDRALALLRSAHVPATGDQGTRLVQVANRAETILRERLFSMHFQPILSLGQAPLRIRFESLMRVHDSELGGINPELFFLACERKGLASLADRTVLQVSLATSLPLVRITPLCLGVAVNVTPGTLLEPDFVFWLGGVLAEQKVPWGWLQLEITEHSMVASSGSLLEVMEKLENIGVSTHLDDFGTGFSSLGLLSRLSIGGIKCDRSLLQGASEDPARQIVLEHVCQMARALHLKVTVEGIESEADLESVIQCGATSAQGYWLGRPMPACAIEDWLASYVSQVGGSRPGGQRALGPMGVGVHGPRGHVAGSLHPSE